MSTPRLNPALKANIALDALRRKMTVADLALRYGLHPQTVYAWRRQLIKQAALVFEKRDEIQLAKLSHREISLRANRVRWSHKRRLG